MSKLPYFLSCPLLAGLVILDSPPARADEIVPRTAIFLLVDVSGTWLNKQAEAQNKVIIHETNKAVLDLLQKVETPANIFLIAIAADSVLDKPICETLYSRKLINISAKSRGAITQPEKLADRLELCGMAVLQRPVAKYTDIHGALDMASRLARAGSYNAHYLFMLSDFKEERPKGPLPKIDLSMFRCALIYRILPEDSQDPGGLEDRLNSWRQVLKQAGAQRVIDAVDKGRFAGSVTRKLLSSD